MHGSKSSTPSPKISLLNPLPAVKKKNPTQERSFGGLAGAYKGPFVWQAIQQNVLTPIQKNNRGICGFGHHMTGVTDILIFGLQLY